MVINILVAICSLQDVASMVLFNKINTNFSIFKVVPEKNMRNENNEYVALNYNIQLTTY